MTYGMRATLAAAALLGAAAAGPASAQDASALVGAWTGTIEEDGSSYGIEVDIDLDRSGDPVATVVYEQPCSGVWANASWQGGAWRLDETITSGRERCASLVAVTLTETAGGLAVELHPVEFAGEARGMLYPVGEGEGDAFGDDTAYAPPARCSADAAGIEHGEARDEDWLVNGYPLVIADRSYLKYGLPRVLAASDLQAFASFQGAGVFAEAGAPEVPEVIYVLLGAAAFGTSEECEYQPYQIAD